MKIAEGIRPCGAFIFHILVKSEYKFKCWGPLLRAKFHPHRRNDKGVGPQNKFLLRLDQNVEYKRPAGAYPFRDFHKICRICTPFQDALGVKLLVGFAGGVMELWGVLS